MLLGLVPVFAAAEQRVAWVGRLLLDPAAAGRRPVPDAWSCCSPRSSHCRWRRASASTRRASAAAARARRGGARRAPPPRHVQHLRRALRFHTAKLNGLIIVFIASLWAGPLLADLVRHQPAKTSTRRC
jgi:hypothetical protein